MKLPCSSRWKNWKVDGVCNMYMVFYVIWRIWLTQRSDIEENDIWYSSKPKERVSIARPWLTRLRRENVIWYLQRCQIYATGVQLRNFALRHRILKFESLMTDSSLQSVDITSSTDILVKTCCGCMGKGFLLIKKLQMKQNK